MNDRKGEKNVSGYFDFAKIQAMRQNPMSTAIDIYLNQISLTGGIPFAVTLPKVPNAVNADLMTTEDIHAKLQKGYDDIEAGKVQDAATAFEKLRTMVKIPFVQTASIAKGIKSYYIL